MRHADTSPGRSSRRALARCGASCGGSWPPRGLALLWTECQPSIRAGTSPVARLAALGGPDGGRARRLGWGRRRAAPASGRGPDAEVGPLIFKAVRNGRPYPDHGLSPRDWAAIPPRQVRLDTLVTTKRELALDALLADDSTFYGDLFPHAVQWRGDLYLEDGLHRALRSALQQRTVIHVRVLDLDAQPVSAAAQEEGTSGPSTAAIPAQPQPPVPTRRG